MTPAVRVLDGIGFLERSVWRLEISRLGGWMGAGGMGVLGKKTESKLVLGEVGVSGERRWKRFSTSGEDVLGMFWQVWIDGLVGVKDGWECGVSVSVDDSCWISRRLIWLSLLDRFLLSDLTSTCRDTGGSLVARRSLLTLPRVLAEVRARSMMATWLGLSDWLCLW